MDGGASSTEVARFRLYRPQQPAAALGLAVSHLMTKPAFANLRFGEWSRVLVGQINRGHYTFAIDSDGQIQGFVGWALTSRDNAENWVQGRRNLTFQESLEGDCVVFNAWAANSLRVHRFLVDEARKMIQGKDTLYFRRAYPDGSSRPVRLPVNEFVSSHIRRRAGDAAVSALDG
ncbi:toxin-activating lysine-acyltransferase [Hansschlegelia plantiphila]|uniref:Toxin-activating lysine-acyltransferase n=1 Tax=Hansschlegelia plantiphila TaxID=374655 RepID=A0A9W6IZN5_9HYPH|nr:toxin-activating lysine-acyltransferase [Hansschlegelia plantiphila]GLK66575.1 hypothetical protein GCM10008179_02130 [Hansschlegelia plantiphila]